MQLVDSYILFKEAIMMTHSSLGSFEANWVSFWNENIGAAFIESINVLLVQRDLIRKLDHTLTTFQNRAVTSKIQCELWQR